MGIFESSAEVEFSYDDRHILLKKISSFTFLVFHTVIYKIFIEKCFKLLFNGTVTLLIPAPAEGRR